MAGRRHPRSRLSLPAETEPTGRLCACGRPTITARHRHCATCRRRVRRTSGRKRPDGRTGAERGYGPEHEALRRALAPHVAAGSVACARCGLPIAPGEPWDLGHDDRDRGRYAGPEHRACNRATAGRRTAAPAITSRRW